MQNFWSQNISQILSAGRQCATATRNMEIGGVTTASEFHMQKQNNTQDEIDSQETRLNIIE
jgi:hypothetical protein